MAWKNNRPDRWERILLAEVKKVPDPELLKGDLPQALLLFAEAGADAMMEALTGSEDIIRVEDKYYTMPGFLTDIEDYIFSLGRGTWAFIPDEE